MSAYRVKGWHVGAGVVAFFAVVIAVDAAFVMIAYRSHPGQVAARPYEAGLLYNAELKRERAQAALGWQAAASAEPGQVVVWLNQADGQPLTGVSVEVELTRPATEDGRTTRPMTEAAPGRFVAQAGDLAGTWDARIVVKGRAGQAFEARRRLTWP